MLPPLRLLRHRTLSLDNLYISITIYYENINVKEYLLWTLNLLKLSKTRPRNHRYGQRRTSTRRQHLESLYATYR